jgi:chemotaxis protein methyltransferase CheR
MLLLDRFDSTWDLSILATDISNRALEAGRAAVFPLERSADVPQKLLKRHMLRGTGDNARRMRAGPELRALVTFRRLNFRGDPYPEGPFDLIFCRNVLMYFDAPTRASIAEKLLDRLDPSGFLLMGHAESLNGVTTRGRPVFPTIYARAEAALEGFPHASRSRWRVDG